MRMTKVFTASVDSYHAGETDEYFGSGGTIGRVREDAACCDPSLAAQEYILRRSRRQRCPVTTESKWLSRPQRQCGLMVKTTPQHYRERY